MNKPCFVIPVYNHEGAIGSTLESLRAFGLPCVLVDDGCDAPCRDKLQQLAAAEPEWLHLVVRKQNGGKGAAVKSGLREAHALGYSHAIQVDADGQHNPADIPQFITASEAQPSALICGYPVYDESVPLGRFIARYLTHVWVWINSRSLEIRDSMCGLRSYPLAATVALLDDEYTGDRMDFDPEVLVRWHWRGYGLVQLPVKVCYPVDGVSHFRGFEDNMLISAMHTRLFFGMLARLFQKRAAGKKIQVKL